MKNINIKYCVTFVILLFAGVFQGCEDLEENTSGLISSDSFYADEQSLKAGVMGIYRTFSTVSYQTGWYIPINGDDILTTRTGSNKQPYRDYDQFQATGGQAWEYDYLWLPPYKAIRAANSFIESIENNFDNIDLDPSIINYRLGEAKYMRASTFFMLARIYGDIPYFESTAMKDSTTRRLDKRVVLSRVINDLEFAEEHCVENKEAAGQVTKWAAKAALAQVYMQLTGWPYNETDKWSKVKQYCEDIISSGKFELMPDYGDLFKYTKYSNNKEDIHTLTYGLASTGTWQRIYGKPMNDWNDMHCQWRFYNDFPEGERKSFSLQATMKMYPYYYFTHPCFSKFLFGTIKFDPQGKNDQEYIDGYEHTWQTSNNIAMERFSNIYLMWAEADANITNSISAQALEYLNKVKRRAKGDINGIDGNYYNTPMSGVDVAVSDFGGVSDFKKEIVAERGWEFAGEWGYRWFDLVRLKMIGEVTSKRNDYNLDDAIKVKLDDWIAKNPSATADKIAVAIADFKTQATELPLTDANPTVEKYGFAHLPLNALEEIPGLSEPPLTSFEE